MGLFDVFKKDPETLLERARTALERGDAAQALRLARQVGEKDSRAAEVVSRARRALAEAACERAAKAEESGYLDDAVEWLRTAAASSDGAKREELLGRAEALLRQAEDEAERRAEQALAASGPAAEEVDSEEGFATELDIAFEALVGTLDEDLADLYDAQPEEFRRAFVDLNEGRLEEARAVLERLADEDPADAVRRFERGRCRLHDGEYQAAREDLEAVWETLGDEPVDHAQTLSVPGLWAEAMIGLEKTGELLERLDGVADPSHGDPGLCGLYALALLKEEKLEEAERFLVQASSVFDRNPLFPFHLAELLKRQGRTAEAIDCLETSVKPSCSPGVCGQVPKHLPSLRLLARLHLDEGRSPKRVQELLDHISMALGGELGREDYLMTAECQELIGDASAAREARAAARHAGEGEAKPEEPAPQLQMRSRRPL